MEHEWDSSAHPQLSFSPSSDDAKGLDSNSTTDVTTTSPTQSVEKPMSCSGLSSTLDFGHLSSTGDDTQRLSFVLKRDVACQTIYSFPIKFDFSLLFNNPQFLFIAEEHDREIMNLIGAGEKANWSQLITEFYSNKRLSPGNDEQPKPSSSSTSSEVQSSESSGICQRNTMLLNLTIGETTTTSVGSISSNWNVGEGSQDPSSSFTSSPKIDGAGRSFRSAQSKF
uniref:Uncharacterized protein n=1 Tax=Trichuris muris TaxID=70415 RepID=A0A5S6QCY9_TRIMR